MNESNPYVTQLPSIDRLDEIDKRRYTTKDIFILLDDLDWLIKIAKDQQESIEFLKEDVNIYIKRGDSWKEKFFEEKEKNGK
ncbi:hypothetical protein [Priestia megaterium]|uniref:hypothetical protein n=1 Tax=Priestia megaterium TaxID=1404 RepID=UPI001129FF8D|nr:hypothetical protein [Priestia megaterium]TPF18014.1 hypothetical protein CBE78_01960 [Priestia megaterium]TPF22121.1 hypothetical protein CBE79_04465 [Priestia megaterium]